MEASSRSPADMDHGTKQIILGGLVIQILQMSCRATGKTTAPFSSPSNGASRVVIAQKVLDLFLSAKKTVSIATLAAKEPEMTRSKKWPGDITYEFLDGSRLITKGRGRSHSAMVETKPTGGYTP